MVFFDAVFLIAGFGVGFLLFAVRLEGAAFFVGRALTVAFTLLFRAGAFATVALLALGFEAVFALTARFAALEDVRFAAVLAVDLRKPFERLLLILVLIYKGCPDSLSSHRTGAQLSTGLPLNQSAQVVAGALRRPEHLRLHNKSANIEKHLMVIVGYATVRLGLERY